MKNSLTDIEKIIALLPGSVYWKNREGIYLGCNDTCAKLVGFKSPKDIIGKTLFDILTNETREYAEIIDKTDNEVMNKNITKILEELGPNEQGEITSYLTKKSPIHDEQGNVIGLLGMSLDFTLWKNTETELLYQIKQSEQNRQTANTYLTNMLANLPENFYWVDKESNVLGCNENQARILGFKSSKDLIGKYIYDVGKLIGWDEKVSNRIRENDLEVMETRKTTKKEEELILNGETKTYTSIKSPLIGPNDEVIGVFGVSVDVTERKQTEQALLEALKKAEAANVAKSNFIRNMSHDLRTPFMGILGFSSYLENMETNSNKKELLGYIKQSCEKLLSLINDILYLTSLETGQQELHQEETNIKELINDVKILMLAQIKNKNLEFIINLHKNLPEIVVIDKTRIHRILLNLVSNALKFTDKGAITIDAYISDLNPSHNTAILHIDVTDTGMGIPVDKKEIIFDRFTRLTPAYEGKYEGTGLELYIVKELLEECDGTIEVESEEDVGSKFKCRIPYKLI